MDLSIEHFIENVFLHVWNIWYIIKTWQKIGQFLIHEELFDN
jgi:hypothetical protein